MPKALLRLPVKNGRIVEARHWRSPKNLRQTKNSKVFKQTRMSSRTKGSKKRRTILNLSSQNTQTQPLSKSKEGPKSTRAHSCKARRNKIWS